MEGAIFVTGAAIQWLRDGLGIIERARPRPVRSPRACPTAAASCSSPRSPASARRTGIRTRGTILGLTRGTGARTSRAVVESMAYQTRDVVDAVTAATGTRLAELRVDGGASVMDLLCQLQADLLGVTVRRPAVQETTALGAAYLAGLAEGRLGDPGRSRRRLDRGGELHPVDARGRSSTRGSQPGAARSSDRAVGPTTDRELASSPIG